jgi:hypothetical protein
METKLIEARHKQIAASVLSGMTDETEGRKLVAALVVESGAASRVAKERASGITEQEIADITVSITDKLVDKILDAGIYDFAKASNNSLIGWAMVYGRQIRETSLIDFKRANNRCTPFSHHEFEDIDGDRVNVIEKRAAEGAWTTQSNETTDEEEVFALALELLTKNKKGLRGSGRLFADAAALCMGYQFPSAVRNTDFNKREIVRQSLVADKTEAYWSLHDFHEIASLEMDLSESTHNESVLELWENFSIGEANLLLSLPSEVAHTIALAATSPKPKPAGRDLDKFRSEVRKMSSGSGWKPLALKLTNGYIATEYEVFSEFNSRELDEIAIRDHEQSIIDFPKILAAVANFPGHPLGVTATDIRTSLTTAANAVLGNVFTIEQESK